MAEPWVSVDEVAAHLGVQKVSVYRWIEQHGLPATKIGKLWKLKLSEVDAWMLARRTGGSAPEREAPRTEPSPRASAPSRFVLVIDDDAIVRDTLEDFLRDEGYGTLLASSGAEALEVLSAASPRPNLILLDLKMPNLDGWQFLERQARDPALAAIPVIVVTGLAGASVNAAAVLRKPLQLDRLAAAMGELLVDHARAPEGP